MQRKKCGEYWSSRSPITMAINTSMTSSKPYLLMALNTWILDNQMTPFLLVDANVEGVKIPQQHIKDGKITLNITPSAVQDFTLKDEWIYFSARFSGQPFMIHVPMSAILAIYAKENGLGMMFNVEENTHHRQAEPIRKPNRKKPKLTIVQ